MKEERIAGMFQEFFGFVIVLIMSRPLMLTNNFKAEFCGTNLPNAAFCSIRKD